MKVLRFLNNHGEETLCVIALVAMSLAVGLQVVMRYIFEAALSWSEELARYLCIWLVFVGSSFAVRKGRHICVDALYGALPPKAARCVAITADVIFLIFAVLVLVLGLDVLQQVAESGQDSPAMGVRLSAIYSALPVGFVLICFRLLQNICLKLRDVKATVEETPATDIPIP